MIDTNRSTVIGKLALALSQAQGEITGAKKESKNPFFKSNYADLASCWDACRESLSKHKLAVIQTTDNCEGGVVIITTLVHESGQWIRGFLIVQPTKKDPQALGSAITYGRRYALSAIVGLAQVDDDGNAASAEPQKQKNQTSCITSDQIEELRGMFPAADITEQEFLATGKYDSFDSVPRASFIQMRNWLRKRIATIEKERGQE